MSHHHTADEHRAQARATLAQIDDLVKLIPPDYQVELAWCLASLERVLRDYPRSLTALALDITLTRVGAEGGDW